MCIIIRGVIWSSGRSSWFRHFAKSTVGISNSGLFNFESKLWSSVSSGASSSSLLFRSFVTLPVNRMPVSSVGRLSNFDPNSFSNPDEIRTEKLHLSWNVNFERKLIEGIVNYDLVATNDTASKLVLDSKDLVIKKVFDETGSELKFSLGDPLEAFGQSLTVELPQTVTKSCRLSIQYETTEKCSALQWLSKEMTAGKAHPYMFSQCEAIHARSMLPCQDTPGVKAPFTAEVTAPKDLVVLMSACRVEEPHVGQEGLKTHKFEQKIPVPSYLIAIVTGDLESRVIGPRSRVWSEKEFVDAASNEFSETEDMLQAAESILGEYVWGIYDILVLPPSFPFGGMENPCLTFATPTLLAGDKSLASVIAHEISHSWTGNLVTNRTFEHFWLNEGFTVFAERKIIGRLKGEQARQFDSIEGWGELEECVNELGATNPLTQLVWDLTGVDPDDAFSKIPYEKGYAFLYYLEEVVGGPSVFEPFLKEYISDNKMKSIDTQVFKAAFVKYFTGLGLQDKISSIDWDTWLNKPGLPIVKCNYDTTLTDACTELKNRWINWNCGAQTCPFTSKDLKQLSAGQIQAFLSMLIVDAKKLSLDHLKAMEEVYNMNQYKNSEIRFRWLRLSIQGRWKEQIPLVLQFVTEQGRMKFVRPLYSDLYAWEEMRPKAIETFQKNRKNMMGIAEHLVAKVLHLK